MFRADHEVTTLLPGGKILIHPLWNTGIAVPGEYSVAVESMLDNQTVSSAAQSFSIVPSLSINGTLEVSPPLLNRGNTVYGSYTLSNRGNAQADDMVVTVMVIDPDTSSIMDYREEVITLGVGGWRVGQVSFSTEEYGLKRYDMALYYSADEESGNIDTQSFTVRDGIPPEVLITSPLEGSWYNSDVAIRVIAEDSGSGVESIEQSIDNGAWTSLRLHDAYSGDYRTTWEAGSTNEGSHTLSIRGMDNAGNQGTPLTLTFIVDVTPPVIEITGVENNVTYNTTLAPEVMVIDTNLAGSSITLNGAPFTSGSVIDEEGGYLLVVLGEDRAGNRTEGRVSFSIVFNTPPLLGPVGNREVNEGELLAFTVTASDAEGDDLTFTMTSVVSGALFDSATGIFTWTPGYDMAGTYPGITFTVTDNGTPPMSDSETITITVNNINRPPVLGPIANQTVTEGELLEFTLTGSDPDNDSLIFTAENLPEGAGFDGVAGVFSWTPVYGRPDTYTGVTFTVSDTGEPVLFDSETIAIEVLPALVSDKGVADIRRVLVWVNGECKEKDHHRDERDDDDDEDEDDEDDEDDDDDHEHKKRCVRLDLVEDALHEIVEWYVIVTERKEFQSEMRNNFYTDYIILGDKIDLKDHFDEELRERIHGGRGIITSSWKGDKVDEEIFGIKVKGKIKGKDHLVQYTDSGIFQPAVFHTNGRAVKIKEYNEEDVLAWITDGKGDVYPAVLTAGYGLGRGLLFGYVISPTINDPGNPKITDPISGTIIFSAHRRHQRNSDRLPS